MRLRNATGMRRGTGMVEGAAVGARRHHGRENHAGQGDEDEESGVDAGVERVHASLGFTPFIERLWAQISLPGKSE